jgi:hypothetical protein
MVSNVMYPKTAPMNLRTPGGNIGHLLQLGILIGAIVAPATVLFPVGVAYLAFGIVRHFILILVARDESAPGGVS